LVEDCLLLMLNVNEIKISSRQQCATTIRFWLWAFL